MDKLPIATVLTNAVLFQAGWFACVLGAAYQSPWIGLAAVAVIAVWHLAHARERGRELGLLLLAMLIGACFETLLAQTGWLRFESEAWLAGTAPAWMVALWANFAMTLNVSLRPLHGRLALAALLGAVGAPIAYFAGSRLGALEFTEVAPALIAVGAGWLLLTPLLFLAARRLDGYTIK